jgi:serine/threonine protein kinase/tetratricopeptide (TPR) repeat protein
LTLHPGTALGSYEILGPLGAGGMGEVYRARDTRLDRQVAIKILPEGTVENAELLGRFEREAKTLARLNHPNVAVVHGFEHTGDHRYLVMELVEGETLDRRIPEGGLSTGTLLELAVPLAGALAEAHRHGVVHRDLKPGNVMVSSEGRLKVLDFGLAKLVADETVAPEAETRAAEEELTRQGAVMGTFPYMSPEQVRGEVVDARSDVFSLGVVLYEMATGRRPFTGKGPDLVSAILRDTPPTVTELNPRLPGRLGGLIARCLAKDPAERPTDGGAVRDELADLQRAEITAPAADGSGSPRSRSKRLGTIAAVALAIAALGALLWLSRSGGGEEDAAGSGGTGDASVARLAVLPFENLGPADDEYLADGITAELISRLSGLQNLAVISRASSALYKDSEKSLREIGKELDVDYVLEGTLSWSAQEDDGQVRIRPRLVRVADETELWSGRYDRTLQEGPAAQTVIASEVVDELDIALSGDELQRLENPPTSNLLAYEAYLRGLQVLPDGHGPEGAYRQAEAMFGQATTLDPDFALAWTNLSNTHLGIYWFGYDVTEERLQLAHQAVQRALELAPDSSEARFALADYHYRRRDYGRALQELSRVFEQRPNDSRVLSHIAFIWRRQGLWDQAIANQEKAARLNPNDMTTLLELSYSHAKTGNFDRALELLDWGFELEPTQEWVHLLGAFTFWLRDEPGDLARARDRLEHFPDPRSFYPASFRIHQELFEENWDEAQRLIANLSEPAVVLQGFYEPGPLLAGLTALASGDRERAREELEEAVRFLERRIAESPDDPRLPSALGLAYAGLGRRDEAVAAGEKGAAMLPVDKDALLSLFRIYDLVRIHAMLGENDEALDYLRVLVSRPSELGGARLTRAPELAGLREDPRFWDLPEGYHVPRRELQPDPD